MTLEILTSDELDGVRHGFFTRRGGASSGVFSGLNCGMGSSDQAEVVAINRARVAAAMNVGQDDLLTVHQVHSSDVVVIEDARDAHTQADAMVTRVPGLGLGVLAADCQPVLFADRHNSIIGAAHAGWKGALGGVLEATIDAMVRTGAMRENIRAVIGPSISQRVYEVGPEFLDQFIAEDTDNSRFFANGYGDRYHFDLPGFGLHRLRRAGIASASWTGHCTYSDPKRFYSYRRSVHQKEVDYGRLISAIRL
ncbi:peptidoglycan editing factor PgeF [Pseudaestuariivita rosea]|uniref:peptidoglycan editing factor PgeF n=1 Tax=Pseudaestuariivita rosea TaxID=2763263 RepID=UPI001ABBA58F|nr:peptidoglycan editing factor PgeF [Pseudaestuariivita rosea]